MCKNPPCKMITLTTKQMKKDIENARQEQKMNAKATQI